MTNDASVDGRIDRPWVCRLGAALLVSAALAVSGCKKQQAAGPSQRPAPLVTTTEVMSRDVPLYLDEIGKCVPPLVVNIRPQVAGRITEVHVKDGAELKKGELMFVIDQRPYQAALAQAKATLAKNQADLELSKVEFANTQKLRGTQAISTEEYDQKRLAVTVNEAVVKAGEAAVETAQLNLEYCTIESPIDGRGGARLVDIGNVVKENEGTLMVVQSLDPIYADFTIPENRLPEVRRYMAEGTLSVEAQLPADSAAVSAPQVPNTQPATRPANWAEARVGKLTFLDNSVQDGTGTIKLRATVPNADHHFWPGQFVNVRLVLTVKKDAVLVPQQAMQIGQQGSYVYVVKADDTAEIRPVRPGQSQGNLVVVDEGLKAGERVIVNGQLTVIPGGKVRVAPGESNGNAPADGASADRGAGHGLGGTRATGGKQS